MYLFTPIFSDAFNTFLQIFHPQTAMFYKLFERANAVVRQTHNYTIPEQTTIGAVVVPLTKWQPPLCHTSSGARVILRLH